MLRRILAVAIGSASIAAAAVAPVALAPGPSVSAEAAAGPPPGAVSCSGCHASSASVATPVPRIIGLDQAAIIRAMQEFRSGQRAGTVMDRIARGFTDAEIQAIAAWYASRR